jgi:hypothetical protein
LGSPNRHNDQTLLKQGSSWVDAVVGQGWGLIPIWFGLQAPCPLKGVSFKEYIPLGLKEAAQKGKDQADLAYKSATDLGLDGRAVFFDMEPYPAGGNGECAAAVRAYIGSFVNEMKTQSGGVVGAYGDVFAAATDFYNSSPRPDEIWIANNSGRVTVWNLTARDLSHPKNFPSALDDTK